jgi:hypothetical protein
MVLKHLLKNLDYVVTLFDGHWPISRAKRIKRRRRNNPKGVGNLGELHNLQGSRFNIDARYSSRSTLATWLPRMWSLSRNT